MTKSTVAELVSKLEARGPRVVFDEHNGRWYFKTLGGTISYAGTTRASAVKKMLKWDNDSRYWEAYNAAKAAGASVEAAKAAGLAAQI